MLGEKTNASQTAEVTKEDVLREIDYYLRETKILQDRMKEHRKKIDALRIDSEKRLRNIDLILDQTATSMDAQLIT